LKRLSISLAVVALVASGITASAAATASAGSKPILIGSIMPETGAYSAIGQAADNSAKMAVTAINKAGGVLGRKLKIVYTNDDANTTTSALLFKKFVSEGATAILGSGDTATTTVTLASQYKIPDIGLIDDGGTAIYPKGPGKAPYPWAWSTSFNGFAVGQALGIYASNNCPNGLYIVHDGTYYGLGGLAGFQISYKKTLKGNDTIDENWSSSQPAAAAMDAEIGKIVSSGASCADVWLTPQDQATFLNEVAQLGDTGKFVVMGNDDTDSDTTMTSLAGANANGMITADLTVLHTVTAADKAYTALYKKLYKIAPTPWGMVQYDAVNILAKAITAAGSTNAAKLKTQLNKITNFPGLTGKLTFTSLIHTSINGPQFTPVKYSSTTKTWSVIK
jgi:branched-chain amino acid transport system substrate-binding protein